MKRLLLPLMLLVASLSTFAHHFEVDGVYYRILSDANLTCEVTYEGIESTSSVYSGDVVIPSQVTNKGKTYSVTSIGTWAFEGCSGLTSITIPNSVTDIGPSAFSDCTGLTSVTFPNSVTRIGNGAFWKCTGLTSVTIPNSVTNIENYAFAGCTSLPVIDNLRYADSYIVEAVDKSLGEYKLKENSRYIGNSAFSSCTSLRKLELPKNLVSIGQYAFYDCYSLQSVIIPKNVKSIGEYAFGHCSMLSSLTVKALTPPVCGSFALTDIDKSVCQLYVPYGTKGYYWVAYQWRDFDFVNELEKEPDAIKDVNADAKATTDGKFLENGRLIIRKAGKTYNASGVEM